MADVFAKGTNGLIAIDGDVLTIDRTGFGGPGPRRIPLASITSVEWQPARVLTSGFIRFTVSGGPPDGVTFRRGQTKGFTMVRAAVEQSIAAQPAGAPSGAAQPDIAGEIEKLAALRDQNLITEAEFDAKKAELLDRL